MALPLGTTISSSERFSPPLLAPLRTSLGSLTFGATSIRLFEATELEIVYHEHELDDESFLRKLDVLENKEIALEPSDTPIRVRTIIIPWEESDQPQLKISSASLLKLYKINKIPDQFHELVLQQQLGFTNGHALFFRHDINGKFLSSELFYLNAWTKNNKRSYIYTSYDFLKRQTTNLCINFELEIPSNQHNLAQINLGMFKTGLEEPLHMHILLIAYGLETLKEQGRAMRIELIADERTTQLQVGNPQTRMEELHDLAQRLHRLVDYFADLEDQIRFILQASDSLQKAAKTKAKQGNIREADMMAYQLTMCQHSKRWAASYRDRTNIRINLAFHLSTQKDNDTNYRISQATAVIAKDSQRDSSSMITLAAVTMFFLPGTFVSAIFGMAFFNFQEDTNGRQQFHVSKRWWYFIVITVPLTLLVFWIWDIWRKNRFARLAKDNKRFEIDSRGTR